MNARFSEYTTSGAFTLGLTRNQVSALAMMEGGAPYHAAAHMAALERKGLVEAVAAPTEDDPERLEFRITFAGALTAQLVAEAGLTNGPADPLARELQDLRRELARARHEAIAARLTARSALARLDKAELDLANAVAKAEGDKLTVRILHRDPLPELSTSTLRVRSEEPTR